MAVTGAIFKTLTFNGESSKNYGVYITGSGAYDAPKRDVEMITIAGRNGSFPLDHGRFENIEVTYPAGIFGDDEEDFADAISNFRNMLCSAKGYCRLEDDYNPDEYRLAIYKSGLEVEPALLKAGEFEIVFECKPQRFLKSGETPVTIGASTTITNPTRFESSPEVRVKGYGTVAFNGYQIVIDDQPYGDVGLIDNVYKPYGFTLTLGSDDYAINGDTITVGANMPIAFGTRSDSYEIRSASLYTGTTNGTPYFTILNSHSAQMGVDGSTFNFLKGTTNTATLSIAYNVTVRHNGADSVYRITLTYTVSYNATNDTIELTVTNSTSPSTPAVFTEKNARPTISASVYGSKSVLGNPTIIDCENGEVYKEVPDGIVSLNSYIDLGAELPKLAVGSDTVTTSGSITECKIIPRWWKI